MSDKSRNSQYVAILQRNDRTARKAVFVPPGQSLDFDPNTAERKWLWPALGSDWHLVEFLSLTQLGDGSPLYSIGVGDKLKATWLHGHGEDGLSQ